MTKIHMSERIRFFKLDAHFRLFIALLVSSIVFFIFRTKISPPPLILAVWISCAFTIIILDWIIIFSTHPREVRRIAKLQDSSLTFIFSLIAAATVASLGAIIYLLKSIKSLSDAAKNEHILLAIGAVIISWFLLHTIYTLRYARLYYDNSIDIDGVRQDIGGLQFPGKDEPDYLDFVYFSFIIGMTFQVSDVNITSRKIRRACILHALLSFAFNTVIVALSINVISGMVSS